MAVGLHVVSCELRKDLMKRGPGNMHTSLISVCVGGINHAVHNFVSVPAKTAKSGTWIKIQISFRMW